MKTLYTVFFCLLFSCLGNAQQGGFAWGVKGGLAIGLQQWNSFERDPLFRYQGDIYIESYDGPDANALFAQAGYHVRGSAIRRINNVLFTNGNVGTLPARTFEFNNISAAVGFKQRFDFNANKAYYYVGLRGEYTTGTNIGENQDFVSIADPIKGFVRPLNYGLSGGAGMEFMFLDLIGGIVELNFAPDISFQYRQPALPGTVTGPGGNQISIGERRIRNFSIELTVGFRFLRVVEYID
jgi:hypothetical protein